VVHAKHAPDHDDEHRPGRQGWLRCDRAARRRDHRASAAIPRAPACSGLLQPGADAQPTAVGPRRVHDGGRQGRGDDRRLGKSELSHDDPALLECLEQAAWALDVPAGNLDTQVYAIHYPIDLIAPEGGVDPQTSEHDAALVERLVRTGEVLADYQKAEKAKAEQAKAEKAKAQ
jgi:hypothetical protein